MTKDLMTLEETIAGFFASARPIQQGVGGQTIGQESYRLVYTGAQLEALLEKVRSALHHLEAGKAESCTCEPFKQALDRKPFDPTIQEFNGHWAFGTLSLPAMKFCPWCGGKVPTAQETSKPC